jgi:hypothetical protein
MLPSTGDYFLNGDSYGDEQRFGLRCPGALVVTLGPLWLLGVALPPPQASPGWPERSGPWARRR